MVHLDCGESRGIGLILLPERDWTGEGASQNEQVRVQYYCSVGLGVS